MGSIHAGGIYNRPMCFPIVAMEHNRNILDRRSSMPETMFSLVFLLHDNRAMSIEFMFVLLHHFVYCCFQASAKIITNYYRAIISRAHL